jgi:hypothetical protein
MEEGRAKFTYTKIFDQALDRDTECGRKLHNYMYGLDYIHVLGARMAS